MLREEKQHGGQENNEEETPEGQEAEHRQASGRDDPLEEVTPRCSSRGCPGTIAPNVPGRPLHSGKHQQDEIPAATCPEKAIAH